MCVGREAWPDIDRCLTPSPSPSCLSRGLKQLSLAALDALLLAPSCGPMDAAICGPILQESALILSDADTHSLFLNLRMLHSVLAKAEADAQQVLHCTAAV